MTRFTLIIPLALAACATCPPESVICDEYARCVCEGPTGATSAAQKAESRDTTRKVKPTRPRIETPEIPREPVDRNPTHPGKEPDKATDPGGWKDWRDAMDRYQEGT